MLPLKTCWMPAVTATQRKARLLKLAYIDDKKITGWKKACEISNGKRNAIIFYKVAIRLYLCTKENEIALLTLDFSSKNELSDIGPLIVMVADTQPYLFLMSRRSRSPVCCLLCPFTVYLGKWSRISIRLTKTRSERLLLCHRILLNNQNHELNALYIGLASLVQVASNSSPILLLEILQHF